MSTVNLFIQIYIRYISYLYIRYISLICFDSIPWVPGRQTVLVRLLGENMSRNWGGN